MQYRKGTFVSTTAAVTLKLGFVPDKVEITNYTKTIAAPAAGVCFSQWFNNISANGTALIDTYTAGAPVRSLLATNGVTPVSLGAAYTSTVLTITNISSATPGVVTVSSIGTLVNGDTVTISNVEGTVQLNTNRYIVGGISGSTFKLYDFFGNPINTSVMGAYVNNAANPGQVNIVTTPAVAPVLNPTTGQVITPGQPGGLEYDTGYAGVTLGTGVVGSNNDVIFWEAWFETPTGY